MVNHLVIKFVWSKLTSIMFTIKRKRSGLIKSIIKMIFFLFFPFRQGSRGAPARPLWRFGHHGSHFGEPLSYVSKRKRRLCLTINIFYSHHKKYHVVLYIDFILHQLYCMCFVQLAQEWPLRHETLPNHRSVHFGWFLRKSR